MDASSQAPREMKMRTPAPNIGERIVTGLSASVIVAGFVLGEITDTAFEMQRPRLSIYSDDLSLLSKPPHELRRRNALVLADLSVQRLPSREKSRSPRKLVSLTPTLDRM
jgi:hypothetical protein